MENATTTEYCLLVSQCPRRHVVGCSRGAHASRNLAAGSTDSLELRDRSHNCKVGDHYISFSSQPILRALGA